MVMANSAEIGDANVPPRPWRVNVRTRSACRAAAAGPGPPCPLASSSARIRDHRAPRKFPWYVVAWPGSMRDHLKRDRGLDRHRLALDGAADGHPPDLRPERVRGAGRCTVTRAGPRDLLEAAMGRVREF